MFSMSPFKLCSQKQGVLVTPSHSQEIIWEEGFPLQSFVSLDTASCPLQGNKPLGFKPRHEAHLIIQKPTIFHNYYPASHSFSLPSLLLRALRNPLSRSCEVFLGSLNPSSEQQVSNHISEKHLVAEEPFLVTTYYIKYTKNEKPCLVL